MLSGPCQFGWIIGGIFEQIFKNVFVFLVDHVRHRKVSLQPVDLLPELCLHVGHVCPLFGLVEEVRQSKFAASQESGQRDAVSFDGDVGLANRRQVGAVTGHVQGTGQPVQLCTLEWIIKQFFIILYLFMLLCYGTKNK